MWPQACELHGGKACSDEPLGAPGCHAGRAQEMASGGDCRLSCGEASRGAGWGHRKGGTGRVKWQTIQKVNKKARLEGKRVAIKARVIRETKGKAWTKGGLSLQENGWSSQKSRKPSCEVVSSLSLEVCKPGCKHLGLGRPRADLCIRAWLRGLLRPPRDGGSPGDNTPSYTQSQGFFHIFCGHLNGGRRTQNCKLKAALRLDIDACPWP